MAVWLLFISLFAVSIANESVIRFKRHALDTSIHPQIFEESLPSRLFASKTREDHLEDSTQHWFIVQATLNRERYGAISDHLKQNDIHTTLPLRRNSFMAFMNHSQAEIVSKSENIKWVGYTHPLHKMGSSESSQDNPKILVSLAQRNPRFTEDEVNSIISRIVSHASEEFGKPASVFEGSYSSYKRIAFVIHAPELHDAFMLLLAEQPEVEHVSIKPKLKLMNDYARGIVLTGTESLLDVTDESNFNPIHPDINGVNQVIGIADDGLDHRNCFFADEAGSPVQEPPFKTWKSNPSNAEMINPDDIVNRRKIVQYVITENDKNVLSDDAAAHGTHVSGSAAGYPALLSDTMVPFSGMAIGSKIAFFDFGDSNGNLGGPDDLDTGMFPWAYAAGARIHSNSWGTDSNGYDIYSQDVDSYMYNNKNFLILAAAGNSGQCGTEAGTVNSPSTSKNAISVGASLNSGEAWPSYNDASYEAFSNQITFDKESMADFSSIGPASDGRLKPDVVAPGYYIYSAAADQSNGAQCGGNDVPNVVYKSAGTSMATPILAGIVALARQYFTSGFFPNGSATVDHAFTPSGGLLKNIIINSAVEMTGRKLSECDGTYTAPFLQQRPAMTHGFGRVQLDQVLHVNGSSRNLLIPSLVSDATNFFDRSISNGQTHSYEICAFSGQEIRITLVWIDRPALSSLGQAIVNDLDLRVTVHASPDEVIFGNTQSGVLGTATKDSINTVEAVYLSISGPGAHVDVTIDILEDITVLNSPQPYSLVVSGLVKEGTCGADPEPAQPDAVITTSSLVDEVNFNFTTSSTGDDGDDGDPITDIIIIVVAVVVGFAAILGLALFCRKRSVNQPVASPRQNQRPGETSVQMVFT